MRATDESKWSIGNKASLLNHASFNGGAQKLGLGNQAEHVRACPLLLWLWLQLGKNRVNSMGKKGGF